MLFGRARSAADDETVAKALQYVSDEDLSPDQLTAEQVVSQLGYRKQEWQNCAIRNEGLNCRVYARAAAAIFGIDRFRKQHWDEFIAALDRALMPLELRPPQPQPAVRQVIRAKFMEDSGAGVEALISDLAISARDGHPGVETSFQRR